ncbi:unnamed protein product [Strongylus vulgaris]|uniref:C2H2-type domain-containing protein n=1 Tax=Strongylus vulgaris TaxID=40348 RepID=A0A3P7LUE6_STRVU|nr:unnamed protein product [Strongylus vulgaris]
MQKKYNERSRLHYLTSTDIALLDDKPSATSSDDHICETCDEGLVSPMKLHQRNLEVHSDFARMSEEDQVNGQEEAKLPWRSTMERDAKTVLIKSGMQAWDTKLTHTYLCQFDQTVATISQEDKENKKINCPAFIEIMEHEDGVLDCVACFGHLGHEIEGLPPEEDSVVLCYKFCI